MCFDSKHPSTEGMKNFTLLSIFIVDSTGTTFYDSNTYKASKNKYSLRRDGDVRVAKYIGMDAESRQQVLDLTIEQIYGHIDEINPQDSLDKDKHDDEVWGDMPW